MLLKDIPCVKDQAYFIMAGYEGSWLYEACGRMVDDIDWCTHFVQTFYNDYGFEVNRTFSNGETYVCGHNATIQQHIDDSYDDIMEFRNR